MIKNINFDQFGAGDTAIVLLHGWGLDKSAFKNLIPLIRKDMKIISLDFLGFGGSDNPDEWYDTYEYSYHIFLLLKELQINKVILVGHSFGGRVATILSAVFDLNVQTVILTASAGVRKFSFKRFIKILHYKIIKKLVSKKILKESSLKKFGSDDLKNLNSRIDKNIFIKIINQDLQYLMTKIDVKTLLVWDKKDAVTKYAECKIFNKKIKKSKIILFNTGGHFTYLCNIYKFANIVNNANNKY